ncbi:HAMP domain-containing sensor histidine kinase [Streptomyces sp. NPDC019396]|uniref:sensor histidine kinase n=1 Tax=Streptomyces sp. NPDC019396 TaxID=3154687 RepID=UPI0033CB173D
MPARRPLAALPVRSLRARLTVGLVILLALCCAAVGLATTTALEGFLVRRLDQQLSAVGNHFPASLDPARKLRGDGVGPDTRGQATGTFGACVLRGTVTQAAVVGDQTESQVSLTAADRRALVAVPGDGKGRTIQLSALREYRVIGVPGPAGDVLITGLPVEPVQDTVDQLRLVEAIVFGAALLLTGFAGAAWVRLSLRPLHRVAATASRVAQLPLAGGEVAMPPKVPDTDPRTEVGRVGDAFNRMLRHVEESLARRHASEERLRRFAADASHELRTPVASIRGHAELALRHPEPVPEKVRHSLDRVRCEAARMGELVDDLLLLARLDAGRPLADESVDLTRLVLDAMSDAQAAGPRHRWVLDLPEEPVVVRGDERRLQQVLTNLLANARTHTPAGTEVAVRLGVGEGAGDEVEFLVADDGPGVPQELRTEIFERFVRSGGDGRSRSTGGTGLGLAIAHAVTLAHGGRVELTSRPGRTVFRVVLPRRRGDGLDEPEAAAV